MTRPSTDEALRRAQRDGAPIEVIEGLMMRAGDFAGVRRLRGERKECPGWTPIMLPVRLPERDPVTTSNPCHDERGDRHDPGDL